MNKKFKYFIVPTIIAMICLFSVVVWAKFGAGITENIKRLKYNESNLSLEDLLDLIGTGESEENVIKEFFEAKVEDLIDCKLDIYDNFQHNNFGHLIGTKFDYLRYYRNCVCLKHKESNKASGIYRIKHILDIDYNENGNLMVKYESGETKNKDGSEILEQLSAMIEFNTLYGKDDFFVENGVNVWHPLKMLLDIAWSKMSASEFGTYISNDFKSSTNVDLMNNGYWNELKNFDDENDNLIGEGRRWDSLESMQNEYMNLYKKYGSFKIIEKIDVQDTDDEVIDAQENLIKDDNYTIVGPFKLTFNKDNGVEYIKIGEKEINVNENADDIKLIIEENGNRTWNNDLKKIPSDKIFYLAIKPEYIIASDGEYEIKFRQKKFEYYKKRIVLLDSLRAQQLSIFVQEKAQKEGEVEYAIIHKDTGKKIILKKVQKDYDTNVKKALKGVKVKVYGKTEEGEGWLKKAENEYEYATLVNNFTSGTTWETDEKGIVTIDKLKEGIYYIYEIEVPEGLNQEDQRARYPDNKDPNNFAGKDNYGKCVYLGKTESSEEWEQYVMQRDQYPPAKLTIEKVSYDNKSEKINGIGLKIYANYGNNNKGWVKEDGTLTNNFSESKTYITEDDGSVDIENLRTGDAYYIYEVRTDAAENQGYNLESQRTRYPDARDPNEFAGKDEFGRCVYLGRQIGNATMYQYKKSIYQYKNEKAKLTVKKIDYDDETIVLNNVQFAIFKEGSGWLGYDNDNKEVTYGNDWDGETKATKFATGAAYCGETRKDGEFTLNELEYGNYYIVEVGTGSPYYLMKDQAGYNATSNYDFLTEEKWKMGSIESVLIGKESYKNRYTSVEMSNSWNYDFIASRKQAGGPITEADFIHLDWYNSSTVENQTIYYGTNHATFTVKDMRTVQLIIEKKDEEDKELLLDGAEFFVEYTSPDGQYYYLSVEKDDKGKPKINKYGNYIAYYYNPKKTEDDAEQSYAPDLDDKITDDDIDKYKIPIENGNIKIDGIRKGNYYLYEVKAPNGYNLEDQDEYEAFQGELNVKYKGWVSAGAKYGKHTIIYVDDEETEKTGWGYFSIVGNNVKEVKLEAINKKRSALEIIKKDADTGEKLNGAKFKIYAVLNNGTKGWVSGGLTEEKEYKTNAQDASEYDSYKTIKKLRLGTYYIYETKAPNGYYLSQQDGYHQAAEGSDKLTGDWVYLGSQNLNDINKQTITLENEKKSTLEIIKVDKDNSTIKLEGAKFKIYATLDNNTRGWVSGSLDGKKSYGGKETAQEYNAEEVIEKLKLGTYYIYETKAPEGYNLSQQEGYHKTAEGSNDLTGDWVYLGSKKLDKCTLEIQEFTATNEKKSTLEIIKVDKVTKEKLSGGEFKIYANLENGTKGWLSGDKDAMKKYGNTPTVYYSEEVIKNLKLGTYYIYETKAPTGYNLTKQEGYHQAAEGSSDLTGDWVYLGFKKLDTCTLQIQEFEASNEKTINIKGYVWVDKPDGKLNTTDNIYLDGTNDYLYKDGITVNLYKYDEKFENATLIATTKTFTEADEKSDSSKKIGHYEFKELIKETELEEYYVEFEYDNKKYVCVDPLIGNDNKVNSKVQERTITQQQLNDNNLTGKGRAVTNPNRNLKDYLNRATSTVENLNLGLIEKYEPEFAITEDIAYMKVKFGDYVYRYEYMNEDEQYRRTTVPTVNEQRDSRTFTAKIYPSDVAYNMEGGTDTLKVYVVYRILVYNNTTTNIDNNYIEEKMYINSLTNAYDKGKYVLSQDQAGVDIDDAKQDFSLWADAANAGEATYNYNGSNRAEYKDGIAANEYATAYVQYQLTEESVEKILGKKLTEADLEKAPSVAKANVFHEYWRADNVWQEGNDKYYEGKKQQNYDTSRLSNKTHYLHKSIDQEINTSELWMRFDIPEKERAVTGTVFEDTVTKESKDNKESLGNGIKEDSENTVSKVKVELINSKDATQAVDLYQYDEENKYNVVKAEQTVEEGGNFEFKGVIPGYYYIRFTYGDGSQRLYDTDGNVVKINGEEVKVTLNDYKSTIIDAKTEDGKKIQAAMEAEESDNSKAEWYKDITGESYSTAVDNLEQRNAMNGYIYNADGTITDKDGNEVDISNLNINAYTPKMSITIENDTEGDRTSEKVENIDERYSYFGGFNFGIIKAPKTVIKTEKKITNMALTNQVGTVLVSANPSDKTNLYITALDEVEGGSKNAKLEIDTNNIYGSSMEATYEVTLKNESDLDYIESNEQYYGYYYKYGIKNDYSIEQKEVTVQELKDNLDEKYEKSEKVIPATVKRADGTEETINVNMKPNETGNNYYMSVTGWTPLKKDDIVTIKYEANALLAIESDLIFENEAQVTRISLAPLTPLTSESSWNNPADTTLTIYGPTGEDRSYNIYIISGIVLIVLATGIVLIKKYTI